jgi:hypothetical protein
LQWPLDPGLVAADKNSVRRPLALIATVAVSLLAVPAVASASSVNLPNVAPALLMPIYRVETWTQVPTYFHSDAIEAVAAAKTSGALQAIHRHEHPLRVTPYVWGARPLHWWVVFAYHGHVVAEADVSTRARLEHVWTGPAAVATYARGNYAPLFDAWWVVVPFSVAFLLPFLDRRRLRRLLHLDALVLLSFIASYALLDHAQLESAVWLAYPPLVYLLARMIWTGFRGRRSADSGGLLPIPVLWIGLIVLTGARIALSLVSHQIIDVGVASVLGAHRLIAGQPLYYNTFAHNDTYGPIAYLAYVPFELAFGWHGVYGFAPAAKAGAIVFDVATIAALLFLGRRLRAGSGGTRLGLRLAWAWAACPLTLLAVIVHTDDALIALLSVLSLLAFSSAAARGTILGLAAAARCSPAALLPLYARGSVRGRRGAIACAISCTAIVVLVIGLYLPPGGLHYFYERTLGFQLTRSDVFSPWALHPALDPIKTVLEIAAVLLAVGVFLFPRHPRERTLTQVCALAAAVTIAVQLPAIHWFYYYVLWFLPFVLVALLGPQQTPAPAEREIRVQRLPSAADALPDGEIAMV